MDGRIRGEPNIQLPFYLVPEVESASTSGIKFISNLLEIVYEIENFPVYCGIPNDRSIA